MPQYTYRVLVDKQIYARDMELATALILVQALFDKWYNEPNLAITVEREDDRCVTVVDIEDSVDARQTMSTIYADLNGVTDQEINRSI